MRKSGWFHLHFNPRSRKGSDTHRLIYNVYTIQFQSTLPQGERLGTLTQTAIILIFQSTLPQGERRRILDTLQMDVQFQSTLPQGERRPLNIYQTPTKYISIHAPARGATNWTVILNEVLYYFNPRSRKGSDDR